ncbi:S1 RNA-binding domain-containing protein [Paenibacillus alkaliterrae]|uniref:S1 RNA-binding domain-containing protein n=1 Tax=Paenibacillus alkaliterrae TaxID=320909 RepID=UPI001F30C9C1|nr:S1 RNA-binding domain-containing protein [Paenibacillus alkaliterrae]MCF2940562.1 S1 RNA-binding domain-containing protein [Paenibacillus alkaliterrae]
MNEALAVHPIKEYRTSLRRKTIHQGTVIGVENHAPFGQKMQVALVELNNDLKGLIYETQFDKQNYRSLVGFIDHTVDFMVLDVTRLGKDAENLNVFDEEKGIVLLSRVQALEELQEEFWETAEIDHVVTGVVSGFEDERLYVRVKGVICVLPIHDYEYDWTVSGRNLIALGTELTVKITFIDRTKRQVRVSRKELLEDPWNRVQEKFGVDNFYRGQIISVVENVGVFVKLAPGIEALAWYPDERKMPKDGVLVGKTCTVRIKNVNPKSRRIGTKIIDFPHEI